MKQLRRFFDADFEAVIRAVNIRHNLIQNLRVESTEVQSAADRLYAVVQHHGLLP
ncbi:hypothetical protein [Streptomyces flaveus]|uniref:hypothetical protein n=1 Tax=Streptomyces flaveus TaxID=66370 RepID=UPI00332BFF38